MVLDVSAIRKQAPDFNSRNFAVMTGTKWIAARELSSQADDFDGDGSADQIVFLADVRANEEPEYWIYYSPSGERRNEYAAGQQRRSHGSAMLMGLDGNRQKRLTDLPRGELNFWSRQTNSLDGDALRLPQNATSEADWGINGSTATGSADLGGLTIWEAGKPYPVVGASKEAPLKFRRRILSKGPVRTTVEVDWDGFKKIRIAMTSASAFLSMRTAAIRKTRSVFIRPSHRARSDSAWDLRNWPTTVISLMRQMAISARGGGGTILFRR